MKSVLQFGPQQRQANLERLGHNEGVIRAAAAQPLAPQRVNFLDTLYQECIEYELLFDRVRRRGQLARGGDAAGVSLIGYRIGMAADQGRQRRVAQLAEQVLILRPGNVTHSLSIAQSCAIVNTAML